MRFFVSAIVSIRGQEGTFTIKKHCLGANVYSLKDWRSIKGNAHRKKAPSITLLHSAGTLKLPFKYANTQTKLKVLGETNPEISLQKYMW